MRRIQSNTYLSHNGVRAKIVTHGGADWRCTKRKSLEQVKKESRRRLREAGLDNKKPADGYSMFRNPKEFPQDRMTRKDYAIAEALRAFKIPPRVMTPEEVEAFYDRVRKMRGEETSTGRAIRIWKEKQNGQR